MPEYLSDSQLNPKQPGILTTSQKLCVLAILAVILVISYLPYWVGKLVLVDMGISTNDLMVFLVLPFLSDFLILVCLFFAVRFNPELAGFDTTWIRKTRFEFMWLFLLPIVMLLVSKTIIYVLTKRLGMPYDNPVLFFNNSSVFFIVYAFRIAFIAPVVEEIFWRGYAQDNLSKIFGPWIALFTQAVAFAAMHFRLIGGFFEVLIYGLILGLWRQKRRTLLPLIIAHICINFVYCAYHWNDWMEMTKVRVSTNYVHQFNEISRPADYDPNNNAADHYEKASELSVEIPEQLSTPDIKTWPKDLSDEKQILLQQWVSANGDAIEQLKLGAQKPCYWSRYQGGLMAAAMPELIQVRTLAFAICSRAKLNAAKGDFKEAFSDLSAACRFGEHFAGPKSVIEQLVGIGIRGYTVRSALVVLCEENVPADVLKDFQRQLETLSAGQSHIVDFTFEKFFVYDDIQRIFTDDGKGNGHVPKIGVEQMVNPPEALKFLFSDFSEEQRYGLEKMDRRQTTELTDRVFEFLNYAARKMPAQLHREGEDCHKVIDEMTKTNPMLNMFALEEVRVSKISFRCKAETDALITILGLLRYKADKGDYPADLDELLSAGYLKTMPQDPFGPGPLTYRRTADNFILYTFADDFDDDGGARSKWGESELGGDYVFWPVERPDRTDMNTKG